MKSILIFLVILFCILQYRLWRTEGVYADVRSLTKEVALYQEKNNEQRIKNQQLEAEVTDLKNRLGALEERARIDLGMIKKGETFYQNAN